MNIPTTIAIKSIDYYQKELSHRKKYCCSHRALYQGLTCSEYSKQKIAKVGLLRGIKETLFRLKDCYWASKKIKAIKAEVTTGDKNTPKHDKKNDQEIDSCTVAWIAADSACCLLSFLPF